MSDQYPPPGSYPPPGGGGYPPPGGDPYGQQPASGVPYGQPTSGQPYGQQPTSGSPYDQPPAYGQPPYGAPGGAPFGAPPPPPKKSSAGKIILIVLGVILLLVIVCCGGTFLFAKDKWDNFWGSLPTNAKVGDCLAGDSITDSTSKDVSVKIVKCDDASAKYKVVGIVNNVPQAEALKQDTTVCKDYTAASYVLWQGTDPTSGDALCLDDAK